MTPHQVRTLWAAHAAKLSDWGVDLVMAPVVDVGHGPGIGPRAFSAVPEIVSEFGLATTEGISEAGLLPVLKHFPGHGKASGDSHYEIVAGPGLAALRESDLLPYKAIIGKVQVGVMVGHTTIPGYSERPSSQSPVAITKLLREELGFSGLVVSDALGMAAAGEPTQGDALVGFIAAGGDLGIVGPGGSVEGRAALRSALKGGRVSEARLNEAAAAVFGAKGIDPCELEVSPSAPDPSDSGSQPPDEPVRNPTLQP